MINRSIRRHGVRRAALAVASLVAGLGAFAAGGASAICIDTDRVREFAPLRDGPNRTDRTVVEIPVGACDVSVDVTRCGGPARLFCRAAWRTWNGWIETRLLDAEAISAEGRRAAERLTDRAFLDADFDHRWITVDGRRWVQAALALAGWYPGLMDGVWGAVSQRGVESHVRGSQVVEGEVGPQPRFRDVGALFDQMAARIARERWRALAFPTLGVSMLAPFDDLVVLEVGRYQTGDDGLRLIVDATDFAAMERWHLDAIADAPADADVHTVRPRPERPDRRRWVTRIFGPSTLWYVRSEPTDAGWTTVIISVAEERWIDRGAMMSSFILYEETLGWADAPTPVLDRVLRLTGARVPQIEPAPSLIGVERTSGARPSDDVDAASDGPRRSDDGRQSAD